MCGLTAIFDPSHASNAHELAPAILASMSHRGPDNQHVIQQGPLSLFHTLLAVEGDRHQPQPIISACGQIMVAVNGEFYLDASLKAAVKNLGYSFQTNSDSEWAIALYLFYGENFLQYLRGEFAFILWDARQQALYAVRDRFGIKPLLYGQQQNRWYFVSEAKALFAAGFDAAWSRQGLFECFSHQYLTSGSSLFANVKQIPPGHYLKLSAQQSTLRSYWTITNDPAQHGSIQNNEVNIGLQQRSTQDNKNITMQVRDLLKSSVKHRLPTRHRCAFTLSGGIDSSAIVALALEHLDYSPDCYTIAFDDPDYNELPQVESFAREMNLNLQCVTVSRDDLIEHIDQAAYYSEGLASNGQYAAKYLLYRAIAEGGYRVVLSGEGADEAFMGYAHLLQDYALTELNGDKQARVLNHIGGQNSLQHDLMLGKANHHDLDTRNRIPSFLQAKLTFCAELQPLFQPPFANDINQPHQVHQLLQTRDGTRPFAEQSCHLWMQTVLANYILNTLTDGMEMAHAIEGRLPFLDHPLVEFAQSIPLAYKLNGTQTKQILRQSLEGILPQWLCHREKHPFIAPPIVQGTRQSTIDSIFDRFHSIRFKESPIFNWKNVIDWLTIWRASNTAQQKKMDPVLMMLLSFNSLQNHFSLDEYR